MIYQLNDYHIDLTQIACIETRFVNDSAITSEPLIMVCVYLSGCYQPSIEITLKDNDFEKKKLNDFLGMYHEVNEMIDD